MQRCFFFFFFPALRWHSACRAKGDKRGENSEDCWILCPCFNVPLMCEWMQIKICLLFFSWKHHMLQFYKMTVEWNRADDIAYSISFLLFLWPSKSPYVLFKRFQHFHFNPDKLGAFSLLSLLKSWIPCCPIWPGLVPYSTWCSACCLQWGNVLAWLWFSCEAPSGDISIIPDWIC